MGIFVSRLEKKSFCFNLSSRYSEAFQLEWMWRGYILKCLSSWPCVSLCSFISLHWSASLLPMDVPWTWVPCLHTASVFLLCGFYSFVSFFPISSPFIVFLSVPLTEAESHAAAFSLSPLLVSAAKYDGDFISSYLLCLAFGIRHYEDERK